MSADRNSEPPPPLTIVPKPDGWWLVDASGQPVAGPFRTLRGAEDWLDLREARRQTNPSPSQH